MFDLILRKGLGKKDKNWEYHYQWKFDVIWGECMSKVSGHANWSRGKCHHGLMSFHKPKGAGSDNPTYVSKEDEVFLVLTTLLMFSRKMRCFWFSCGRITMIVGCI